MPIKMITLVCENCEEEFERRSGEVNRKKNRGKSVYCSRSCSASAGNKKTPRGTTAHLDPANRRDDLTPFRYAMKIVKNRGMGNGRRVKHCEIDEPYLKKIWDEQGGKCPFTGWDLILPDNADGWKKDAVPQRASLDRIDNDKDYVKGNVRFVSVMFNYCRNGFSDDDVVDFCKAVCM